MPKIISQFWQELKRRGVIKVITMYAATAFIIMEAAEIMLPRLGLPDWTVTFLIILLIVGFPITIILSWIFDITPEGVTKTEAAVDTETAVPTEASKRKLKASDVIISVLVVVVCVLIYLSPMRPNRIRSRSMRRLRSRVEKWLETRDWSWRPKPVKR